MLVLQPWFYGVQLMDVNKDFLFVSGIEDAVLYCNIVCQLVVPNLRLGLENKIVNESIGIMACVSVLVIRNLYGVKC